MDKSYRQLFYNAWQRHLAGQPLSEFDHGIVEVLRCYPEYIRAMRPESIDVEGGENPYLVLGAHMEVKEQIRLDRPAGIRSLIAQSSKGIDYVESVMVELLVHTLKAAQLGNKPPDYKVYLSELRIALGHKV